MEKTASESGEAVIIGSGQLGRIFAGGFFACGHTVIPVTRKTWPNQRSFFPDSKVIVMAVGEDQLPDALMRFRSYENWPSTAARLVLLQNEVSTDDLAAHDLLDANVAVVWFEKKSGQSTHELLPTKVFGPLAPLVSQALQAMDLSCVTPPKEACAQALLEKNLFILASNLAGLAGAKTFESMGTSHRDVTTGILRELILIEKARQGAHRNLHSAEADSDDSLAGDFWRLIERFPERKCRGRVAEARLARSIQRARKYGIETPILLGLQ